MKRLQLNRKCPYAPDRDTTRSPWRWPQDSECGPMRSWPFSGNFLTTAPGLLPPYVKQSDKKLSKKVPMTNDQEMDVLGSSPSPLTDPLKVLRLPSPHVIECYQGFFCVWARVTRRKVGLQHQTSTYRVGALLNYLKLLVVSETHFGFGRLLLSLYLNIVNQSSSVSSYFGLSGI